MMIEIRQTESIMSRLSEHKWADYTQASQGKADFKIHIIVQSFKNKYG